MRWLPIGPLKPPPAAGQGRRQADLSPVGARTGRHRPLGSATLASGASGSISVSQSSVTLPAWPAVGTSNHTVWPLACRFTPQRHGERRHQAQPTAPAVEFVAYAAADGAPATSPARSRARRRPRAPPPP